MKKTLFALLALALCGTAFAGEYKASDYKNNKSYFGPYEGGGIPGPGQGYSSGEDVLFIVDETVNMGGCKLMGASSVSFKFLGENSLSVKDADMWAFSFDVTGDSDAQNYWVESLTSLEDEVKALTLVNGTSSFLYTEDAAFEGVTQSGPLTLGNAKVDYLGYHIVADPNAAKNLITGDNQVALVSIGGSLIDYYNPGQLALVGRITPEPATATLSLLALAGLATRRRRK